MTTTHEIAVRDGRAITTTSPASRLMNLSFSDMLTLGDRLLKSGLLPNTVKTRETAAAIILKGQELRVPPMYALSNIVVVSGKPTCSAELMLALVQRDQGMRAMRVKSTDAEQCTVEYRVPGWDDVSTFTFAMEDAKRAGLLKNQVWNQYPAAMLRARAISACCRLAFPGSIGGMYAAGELGDPVHIDNDGAVVSVSVDDGSAGEPSSVTDAVYRDVEANAHVAEQDRDLEVFPTPIHAELVDQDTGEIQTQDDGREPTRASDRQRNWIRGLWKDTGHTVTDPDGTVHHDAMGLDETLHRRFGVGIDGLTSEQAKAVIDGLQKQKAQREGATT